MHASTIKERAIKLRRQGKSYSEILQEIRVAKSTLAEWLADVGLSKRQKQNLTEKKIAGQKRGAAARKSKRVRVQSEIISLAKQDIKNLSGRELMLIGTCLYWAEGAKEKEFRAGTGIKFSNSDWKMIKVFLEFLYKICGVLEQDLKYELYIHETRRQDVEKIRDFWSNKLQLGNGRITHIYFKPGKIKTKRHNVGEDYVGLVRICVKSSSTLLRRIAGWTEGIWEGVY